MLIKIKNVTVRGTGACRTADPAEGHGLQLTSHSLSILTRHNTRTAKSRLSTDHVYQVVPVEISGDPIRPLMAVSAVAAISEKASAVVNRPDSVILPIYHAQKGSEGDVLKDALIGRQRLSDVSVIVPVSAKVSALVTSLQDVQSAADNVGSSGSSQAGLYVCALLASEDVTKNDIKGAVGSILDGCILTPEGLVFSTLTSDGSLRATDYSKVVLDSVPTGSATEGGTLSWQATDNPLSPAVPWYNTQVIYDGVIALAGIVGGVVALSTGAGVPLGLGLLAVGVNRLIQSVTSSIYDERTQGRLAVTFSPGRLVSDCIAFVSVFIPAMLPISGVAKVTTVASALALNRLIVAEDAPSLTASFGPVTTLFDSLRQVWRIVPVILIALIAGVVGSRSHGRGLSNRKGRNERGPHRLTEGRKLTRGGTEDPLRRFVIRRL